MDSFINFLGKGLDGASQRQRALSNNVANVNTPNYKRKDVDFISVLKKESSGSRNNLSLKNTDKNHITFSGSKSVFKTSQNQNIRSRNDGNNVEIDSEMAEIAKNNIYYNALVQQVSDRFKFLNTVIDRGGR